MESQKIQKEISEEIGEKLEKMETLKEG